MYMESEGKVYKFEGGIQEVSRMYCKLLNGFYGFSGKQYECFVKVVEFWFMGSAVIGGSERKHLGEVLQMQSNNVGVYLSRLLDAGVLVKEGSDFKLSDKCVPNSSKSVSILFYFKVC